MDSETAWVPDREILLPVADRYRDEYRNADPFPHVVIDDFLPAEVLDTIVADFPGPDDASWYAYDNRREIKLQLTDEALMPRSIRHVLQQMNTQPAIEFLEALTGIEGLVPDPHFDGGGLHQIRRGGVLKVHADFDMHAQLKLHRRINVLLYLNHDWEQSFGGDLELWDLEMTRAVRRVQPIANRLCIFETSDTSWHGHPEPLACPPDRTRRSLAWYYYSAPASPREGHPTLFQARPGERIWSFEEWRKNSVDTMRNRLRLRTRLRALARRPRD